LLVPKLQLFELADLPHLSFPNYPVKYNPSRLEREDYRGIYLLLFAGGRFFLPGYSAVDAVVGSVFQIQLALTRQEAHQRAILIGIEGCLQIKGIFSILFSLMQDGSKAFLISTGYFLALVHSNPPFL